jgi:hypothetical protein
MRTLTSVFISALLIVGCGPPKFKPTKPTERAGGVISAVHDKVDEAVVMQMMHELHVHVLTEESGGHMPTPDEIREYANKESPSLKKVLDKGWIIIPPKITRSSIWAYQKETPEKGGWIAIQAGATKVTAEEYKQYASK